ncbi:twin BRCT domain-containing protein [Flammula alnicola]|nr:twin BRCT domain-containing protein [Flammula alnicola]
MSTDEDEDVDFIIAKYRTECWLEQCIYEDRICAPEEQVSFVPLLSRYPSIRTFLGAEQVVLSMSGFDQSESHGLKRLLRALGITLAPTFTRRSTHLLCPSGTGLKFEKSREWGIPVINIHWLAAMASSGTIPQVHDFLVSGSTGRAKPSTTARSPTSDDLNAAMDVDVQSRMNGITNNTSLEPHPNLPISPPSKKAKTIERQPTTLIPDPELQKVHIRHAESHARRSYIAHPSSICTPTRQGSFMSRSGSLADDLHSNSFNASNPQRRNSSVNSDMERVDPDFRVPSSKSPSPMKIPWAGSRASLSPLKIDHKATKALQDSITSLLGKRPSEEGDESNGKKTKRGRPQRKPQSRQPSDAKIAESSTTTSKHGQAKESMRVMYEDPGQREEKKRLMNLLKSQTGEESMSTLSGSRDFDRKTRRSARIAGF